MHHINQILMHHIVNIVDLRTHRVTTQVKAGMIDVHGVKITMGLSLMMMIQQNLFNVTIFTIIRILHRHNKNI